MNSNSLRGLLAKLGLGLVMLAVGIVLPLGTGLVTGPEGMLISASQTLDIWWPVDGAKMRDTQPFKGLVPGRAVESYQMFWQVDNGQLVPMGNNYDGFPHKEATVDLAGWTWKGIGPYLVKFTAQDQNGRLIGERSTAIWIDAPTPSPVSSITDKEAQRTTNSEPILAASQLASQPEIQPIAQVAASASVSEPAPAPAEAGAIDVWWPTEGAVVSGDQPLKALLQNKKLSEYRMFWQVDGGDLVPMWDSYADYPHKETWISLNGWTWRGSGPYALKFVAEDRAGRRLAEKSVRITVANGVPAEGAQAASQPGADKKELEPKEEVKAAAVPPPPPSVSADGNLFAGAKFYVNPNGDAKRQADEWRSYRPHDAALMDKLAAQPETFWMGGWNKDIRGETAHMAGLAQSQGALPVFVAYNIPHRDCGQHSAGGVATADAYRSWIRGMADGIGGSRAAVIIEPDALTLTDCLSREQRTERFNLIREAVDTFKSKGNIAVYLDAGHARWIDPNEMANRLKQAGVENANGFALNTSNFIADGESIAYGEKISASTGGKRFVIDSGRNGNGTNGEWCNPWGRALGRTPTGNTGHSLVDAFLWVKGPGGSDGWCNGGPSAGTWFPEYALQLIKNAGW